MKLPIAWLKEYVGVNASAEKLAELLTMSGTKVESVKGAGEEAVLEIEITTNRPDCLSLLGLAREISALTGKKVTMPKTSSPPRKKRGQSPFSTFSKKKGSVPFFVTIEDKKGCSRYTARLIENVSVKAAPLKAQRFLGLMGTRPISNVVDATNFVLFETGQPLHAFDSDKLRGRKIIVRLSKQGEKFLGIDGVEYTLDNQTLVIADADRPVAIAGVIGGKETEVTAATQNILLESAYFDAALVRRSSKKYKISTESSYRFERGVDIRNVGAASDRAADLIKAWTGGTDASALLDKDFSGKPKSAWVALRLSRLAGLLGMAVPQNRVVSILKALSLDVKTRGAGQVTVRETSARRDIRLEADLAEEVLRIEGFEKIPVSIPVTRHPISDVQSQKAARSIELKKYLAAAGFQEIMTYSLLSEKALRDSCLDPGSCHRITNPVSAQQEFFRPSLLPGMLESILFNAHRKASSLKFFELGNCYAGGAEESRLSLALYGSFEENWRRKIDASYYDLKGVLGNTADFLRTPPEAFLASLSKVSSQALKNWDIPRDVFYAEISLEGVLEPAAKEWKVKPVPKFPSVRRDIAFAIDERVRVADLEALMKKTLAPHLQEVTLFDQYSGKNIPAGKRSLAFSLAYQKEDGTFTEEEIGRLQRRLSEALKGAYAIEFR